MSRRRNSIGPEIELCRRILPFICDWREQGRLTVSCGTQAGHPARGLTTVEQERPWWMMKRDEWKEIEVKTYAYGS